MQAFIVATLLTSKETQPQSKPFEIYDSPRTLDPGIMSAVCRGQVSDL